MVKDINRLFLTRVLSYNIDKKCHDNFDLYSIKKNVIIIEEMCSDEEVKKETEEKTLDVHNDRDNSFGFWYRIFCFKW